MLLFSILIGVWASLKGNKSPEEFLMGNRSFGPIPISMSLLTSFVSSISILGFSGEAYAHGIQMSLFVFGTGLGITTAGLVILPVIFPLKLTSVNEVSFSSSC
ncbi:UNVERIFIED_CONTAM: hypothetical protein GTU68_035195 [Idotea baltica]|nr:hypothetical protein [Idotea baltica]